MNKTNSLQQFLATQNIDVPIVGFIINLFLVIILAFALQKIYIRFGTSLSNRANFAKNFVLISATTMIIITIVKSSLALSLGLVGALSIVRFRSAIKEPEELAYLFLCIALGLGFGANQIAITVTGFAFICLYLFIRGFSTFSDTSSNIYVTIHSEDGNKIKLNDLEKVFKKHCTQLDLKRYDEEGSTIEACFLVEFDDFDKLQSCQKDLRKLEQSLKITFIDNKGLL